MRIFLDLDSGSIPEKPAWSVKSPFTDRKKSVTNRRLPLPSGPENRYECAIRPWALASQRYPNAWSSENGIDFVPDCFFHFILGPGGVNDLYTVRFRLGDFQIPASHLLEKIVRKPLQSVLLSDRPDPA